MTLPCYARPSPTTYALDRLEWAGGITFLSYGLRIGIRVNNLEVLNRLKDVLPPGCEPCLCPYVDYLFSMRVGSAGPLPNLRSYGFLYGDGVKLAETLDLEHLLDRLESELQLYVAEWAPGRVFVHAGAVGWKGGAVLIPGRSFTGKSTLVAALLRAGATYYSDEYAVLDEQGRVYPYPRRLALRQGQGGQPQRCQPEEFGSAAGHQPLPVRLVAVTRYRPGQRWQARSLSAGQALLALTDNTVSMLRQPQTAFATLQETVRGAAALRAMRGEAPDAAEALLQHLGG